MNKITIGHIKKTLSMENKTISKKTDRLLNFCEKKKRFSSTVNMSFGELFEMGMGLTSYSAKKEYQLIRDYKHGKIYRIFINNGRDYITIFATDYFRGNDILGDRKEFELTPNNYHKYEPHILKCFSALTHNKK